MDFIVFTGDNIDMANQEDLELFLDIISGLKVKPYVLVGNHDLFKSQKMSKESYMHLVQKSLEIIIQINLIMFLKREKLFLLQ